MMPIVEHGVGHEQQQQPALAHQCPAVVVALRGGGLAVDVLLHPSEFEQAQCHGYAANGEQFHERGAQKFGGYEAMRRAHPFKDIVFVEDNPQQRECHDGDELCA